MPTLNTPVEGQHYNAQVPDTLDLAHRGELALHALAGDLDPQQDYQAMGGGKSGGIFLATKFAEAFPAMRVMSGSNHAQDVEHNTMAALLSFIADDGLIYTPANTPDRREGDRGYLPTTEDYTEPCANARLIIAMMYRYQRDQDPAWLDICAKMAAGIWKLAIPKDDYIYFPEGGVIVEFGYLKQSGHKITEEPTDEHLGPEGSFFDNVNHVVRALAQWSQLSGDKDALELARKTTRWFLKPRYWQQADSPDIVGPEQAHWDGHFHGHMISFRSLLWYADVADDLNVKDFVRRSYLYARQFGIAHIGWFPSWVGTQPAPEIAETLFYDKKCEGCILADAVALGVKLSDMGLGDFWDDVDGYVRNQLVEQQFTDPALIEKMRAVVPTVAPHSNYLDREYLGGYCGGSNITHLEPQCFYPSACCVANGALGLYYAWESIVRGRDDTAQVNLLLNRASAWVDIDSYLPYQGKVVLHCKTVSKLSVRIPGWVQRSRIRARVNQHDASLFWAGNYLTFDALKPGDRIVIEFPVVEQTVDYTVPHGIYADGKAIPVAEQPATRYTCRFKANTLIDIAPRQENAIYPLYMRDHYKADKAPIKEVTRYVSPYLIAW